ERRRVVLERPVVHQEPRRVRAHVGEPLEVDLRVVVGDGYVRPDFVAEGDAPQEDRGAGAVDDLLAAGVKEGAAGVGASRAAPAAHAGERDQGRGRPTNIATTSNHRAEY